jgi:intracellular septation protein
MVALAAVFGGLTILFGEAGWIEFRATLVNAAGALAILGGLLTGRLFLKASLEEGFALNDGAWWMLSLRMVAYLLALAALNEVIRLSVSTETWAWFKASIPFLNAGFLALNWPLIRANLIAEEGAELVESPPAGAKSAFNPSADMGVAASPAPDREEARA